jgi:DNA/RNA-binding domain of Phe-tRNA-synthetase-like protein
MTGRFEEIEFDISDQVKALGLTGAYLALGGLSNRESDTEFEEIKEQTVKNVLAELTPEKIEGDPILRGFRQLHASVNKASKKYVASPENLLGYLLQTGHLPHVNLLVDIYNLVSIKTRTAVGAHDILRINGNVHLRLTDGTENFWPLGYDKPKPVGSGEYAYVDDGNDIICRLEVRQVEKTKVTLETTECFFIVQGNAATDTEYIKNTVKELIEMTKKFCGGRERVLYAPWDDSPV